MRYSNSAPSPTEVAEFVLTEDDAVRIEPAPEGKIALVVDNCARSANLEYWGRVELTPDQARAVGIELVRRAGGDADEEQRRLRAIEQAMRSLVRDINFATTEVLEGYR